ncbi:low molecular weight phosphatase family protein [Propionibacteriaceae bacterium Y1923]|uniref:arsenate-mycothiol transferase ArsC n=1 Tax=Aestuariimicrobium sp. Y1814 TaxID=3418742 RepID=UPI003C22647C
MDTHTPDTDAHSPYAPHILFVCVKNAGKSQMAAALLRQLLHDRVNATSAGTVPGTVINALSAEAVAEIGASMEGHAPQRLTDDMLREADRVIVLGEDPQVIPVEGMKHPIERWKVAEPSEHGIEGLERMRLVRDDINRQVLALAIELSGQPGEHTDIMLNLADDLARRYEGRLTREQVRKVVRDVHAEILPISKAPAFVPILVERRAVAVLDAQVEGREPELTDLTH